MPDFAAIKPAPKPGRHSGVELHKSSVRKALPPRREPYWAAPLARGQYVGLRRISATTASWIARYRDADTGKRVYRALDAPVSAATDGGFDTAKAEALRWFAEKVSGVDAGEVGTVEAACRTYVAERRKSRSEACGHDAEKRFERTVYGTAFGKAALSKLRANRVREWRDGLTGRNGKALGAAATNRTLTALKAAMNLAVQDRHASAELAAELRRVKPLPGGNRRRDLYLDLTQRRALFMAAKGGVRDLIEAAALTGARAGELVNASVSQFDARTASMTFSGKTGSRTVPLSPSAVELFRRLAAGRPSSARLLQRDDAMPWGHSDWDERVREAAKAAELPADPRTGTCLYTLRHSFITDALLGGISTLEVARLVGTSVIMIEKHYGHLAASAARARLAKVPML